MRRNDKCATLSLMENETIIKGQIESLAFGGQGILRHQGLVIFVPFTAPGDIITCRILKLKPSFAIGELIQVDVPSPERVKPRCPYFGTCGGCQLQHLSYEEQLEHKRQSVADALKRIGKISADIDTKIVPAKQNWCYRRHVNLKLIQDGSGFKAGYTAVDNVTLLPVEVCPIFVDETNPILKQLQEVVAMFVSPQLNEGKVTILKQEQDKFLLHFHFKILPINVKEIIFQAMTRWNGWSGVIASSFEKTLSYGNTTCSMEIDDLKFIFSSQAFIQNHPEQSSNIYRYVSDLAKKAKASKILDLYCGIGCTTLMLAKQADQVIGIENNSDAIEMAKANAQLNQLPNAVFVKANVEKVIQKYLNEARPDFVLVNPPRTGMDRQVIRALNERKPSQIVYISCMPSTLARDLRFLCEGSYDLTSCIAFDMFPQTAHVETVVTLKKKKR